MDLCISELSSSEQFQEVAPVGGGERLGLGALIPTQQLDASHVF
ncbi:MAG: hypothetical protein ABI548_27965 [Polyangiaceae bacterium]